MFITRYASSVTIIHRRGGIPAPARFCKNGRREHPKVDFILNTVVTEVVGADKMEALKLKNVITGEETTYEADGLFIFIGHTPNTRMFQGQLEMKMILATSRSTTRWSTYVPGVFAAGEAANPHFRQVVTSADGGGGGNSVMDFLKAEEFKCT